MSGEGGTHTSGDLHLRSASWHPCALINKLPRFSELPLLTYRKRDGVFLLVLFQDERFRE